MQKSLSNQAFESMLIEHPEDIFEDQHLSYKSGEIQIIINRFSMAKNLGEVHRWIMDLLNATANFRYASVPSGMFYELRHKNKSDIDLKKLFQHLNNAVSAIKEKLTWTNVSEHEKRMILKSLSYVRRSIYERIDSLQTSDRLLPLWHESDLKKNL